MKNGRFPFLGLPDSPIVLAGLVASRRLAAGAEFRLGSRAPLLPSQWVGEDMTDMIRKTAHAWLPLAMTAAVVGIGIAVATW
jgi:hypothetical protein